MELLKISWIDELSRDGDWEHESSVNPAKSSMWMGQKIEKAPSQSTVYSDVLLEGRMPCNDSMSLT